MSLTPSEVRLPLLLQHTPAGHKFVTFRKDAYVTGYASRYGMKVKTEKGRAVLPSSKELVPVTVVEVVDAYDKETHQQLNQNKK